jgi:hypothetical protein
MRAKPKKTGKKAVLKIGVVLADVKTPKLALNNQQKLQAAKFRLLQDLNELKKKALKSTLKPSEQQAALDEINKIWGLITACSAGELRRAMNMLRVMREHPTFHADFGEIPPGKIGRLELRAWIDYLETWGVLIFGKQKMLQKGIVGGQRFEFVHDDFGCVIVIEWGAADEDGYTKMTMHFEPGACDEAAKVFRRIADKLGDCDYPDPADVEKLRKLLDWNKGWKLS